MYYYPGSPNPYNAVGGSGGGGGCASRDEQLRQSYAARRENHVDLFNRDDVNTRFGIDRPPGDDSFFPTELQLARLIAQHQIHIAPYGAIVYARIDKREVGVKYAATGGDKAKAVRLAVREVLRLVGVTQ